MQNLDDIKLKNNVKLMSNRDVLLICIVLVRATSNTIRSTMP